MTLRKMISQVKSIIKADDSRIDVVEYFNKAQAELNSYCIVPGCNRRLKNFHGQRIHLAKAHGLTKKVVDDIIRVATSTTTNCHHEIIEDDYCVLCGRKETK